MRKPVEDELWVSDEVCFTKENRDDERQQASRAGSGGRQGETIERDLKRQEQVGSHKNKEPGSEDVAGS